ncbi:MAG: hypothetical protein RL660_2473 [Bacteroidota bacterium]
MELNVLLCIVERQILQDLKVWQHRKGRKPLILHGARQVGKTHILKYFGSTCFSNTAYINFEENTLARQLFEQQNGLSSLLSDLELLVNQRIQPQTTLLILDEIQVCPAALRTLKYFNEQVPELCIAAAGSLLGVAIYRDNYSFPVGQVDELRLHAMSFDEFLDAHGQHALQQKISECYQKSAQMPSALHSLALMWFKQYQIVGGMPEVVKTYIASKSYYEVRSVQQSILNNYIADMAKYAQPNISVKIMACFNSIPTQLAKENAKFQYKVVQRGGTASLFGESIHWLIAAGLVYSCTLVEQASLPLAAYLNLASFKLYLHDVGLLCAHASVPANLLLSNMPLQNQFLGALAENAAAQALHANGHKLYYWRSKSDAEVDFLLQQEMLITPVEVKKGKHVRSRSLNSYMQINNPINAIRISEKNFGIENNIKSVPSYAMWCIK